MKYFLRIAKILSEHQQIGISELVELSRINHNRCLSILEWMQLRGYLAISNNKKYNRKNIVVSPGGLEYIKKLTTIPLPWTVFVIITLSAILMSSTSGEYYEMYEYFIR